MHFSSSHASFPPRSDCPLPTSYALHRPSHTWWESIRGPIRGSIRGFMVHPRGCIWRSASAPRFPSGVHPGVHPRDPPFFSYVTCLPADHSRELNHVCHLGIRMRSCMHAGPPNVSPFMQCLLSVNIAGELNPIQTPGSRIR